MSSIFGPARQLGLVVRDFDAALRHWAQVHGVGPFYCIRQAPVDNYRYMGREAPTPIVSLAFGYQGDLQIEVVAQHNDAPSCYLDFLGSGREGAHHVCGWAANSTEYDERYARANAAGLSAVHEGAMGGIRFSYFDSHNAPGGMYTELSEGGMAGAIDMFERMRLAARDWDGRDPIRSIEQA